MAYEISIWVEGYRNDMHVEQAERCYRNGIKLKEALEGLLVHAESKLVCTDEPAFVYARKVLQEVLTGKYPVDGEVASSTIELLRGAT